MKQITVRDFFNQFPDDDACLAHLFNVRFGQGHVCPKCEREAKWYRLSSELAFSCQWCGHHIHPMVGSIFEKSRTPLQLWFYAIFLFTKTRHGVSAKELQRQLGVTYKTAWRMAALIREHMAAVDGEEPLGGRGKVVEVDETYYGGKAKGVGGHWRGGKAVIMGMLERDGDVMLKVVDSQKAKDLMPPLLDNVERGSEIHTDELRAYQNRVAANYIHRTVEHGAGEYYRDGITTNAIESFFSHLKRSIAGTHTTVSHKHLERYVKEFEYRFNRRMRPETMLSELLCRFPELGG